MQNSLCTPHHSRLTLYICLSCLLRVAFENTKKRKTACIACELIQGASFASPSDSSNLFFDSASFLQASYIAVQQTWCLQTETMWLAQEDTYVHYSFLFKVVQLLFQFLPFLDAPLVVLLEPLIQLLQGLILPLKITL